MQYSTTPCATGHKPKRGSLNNAEKKIQVDRPCLPPASLYVHTSPIGIDDERTQLRMDLYANGRASARRTQTSTAHIGRRLFSNQTKPNQSRAPRPTSGYEASGRVHVLLSGRRGKEGRAGRKGKSAGSTGSVKPRSKTLGYYTTTALRDNRAIPHRQPGHLQSSDASARLKPCCRLWCDIPSASPCSARPTRRARHLLCLLLGPLLSHCTLPTQPRRRQRRRQRHLEDRHQQHALGVLVTADTRFITHCPAWPDSCDAAWRLRCSQAASSAPSR